jgi:transposase-like protein
VIPVARNVWQPIGAAMPAAAARRRIIRQASGWLIGLAERALPLWPRAVRNSQPLRFSAMPAASMYARKASTSACGNARIAVLPATTSAELGAFLTGNVAAWSHLLTDGFAGYRGRDAALNEHLKHTPVVQDDGANAGAFFPIIHTLFSNIKAWLVGTHHGVSAKHLPRYLREWSYRFNRRNLPDGLDGYLIRRTVVSRASCETCSSRIGTRYRACFLVQLHDVICVRVSRPPAD